VNLRKVSYLSLQPIIRTCGTHFGETKLVASTTGNLEEASILISSTLTAVGTISFSFCNPSLGPTSTIFTYSGMLLKSCSIGNKTSFGVDNNQAQILNASRIWI